MDLNWVDLGFIVIFLLSIVFGFIRGFIKDVISLIFLVLGIYLAIKYAPQLTARFAGKAAGGEATVSYLILIGMFLLVFIVTIIVGALASYFLSLVFAFGGLGLINSILGGVFGVVRAVIITVAIIYVVQLTSAGNEPVWNQSKIVSYFQPMTQWLVNNVSPTLDALKAKMTNTVNEIKQVNTTPAE